MQKKGRRFMLEIMDYLTFLYTPPLSEVGMQVPI